MAAVTSLITIKEFTYRGDPLEQFSNRYYLRAAPPGDAASWRVLADDLINLEVPCFPAGVKFVAAYGYDSDDPKAHAVWSYDYKLNSEAKPGTFVGTGQRMAGDQAAVVSWRTDEKNSKGKTIYLRKYFHDGDVDNLNPDNLTATYIAALTQFAGELAPSLGAFHGGIRSRTASPGILGQGALPNVTTRTLHRRGKRPLAPA